MSDWDGNVNSPHTMQDEYELARELGASTLTADEDGQMVALTTCRHCERRIVLDTGLWIDPEATGDDSIWRETCDANDTTFWASHEPEEVR